MNMKQRTQNKTVSKNAEIMSSEHPYIPRSVIPESCQIRSPVCDFQDRLFNTELLLKSPMFTAHLNSQMDL